MLGTVWWGQSLGGEQVAEHPLSRQGLAGKYENVTEQARGTNSDSNFPPLVSI